ncbi:hypothetical protein LDG_8449 [Legionella drancourtii LLAP12]|uniref:Uncharacterized protein n=1 Tax=Legionella drancourtii LLAP12 TaxID=658187 RepID=G9ET20_9GAMM|nr:hypothetical protein LDG_8449 [Legionella drancourtii LLAP12]
MVRLKMVSECFLLLIAFLHCSVGLAEAYYIQLKLKEPLIIA